ncbi:pro-corazonin-like [Anopheles bellator]|uniref:pro-corazonin-like n=1 Tax=Anopheles bellator TaxID=139047 RepID=UPI0026483BF9|nr:pro-corazonin-like [Anopheles bellator]
MLHTRTIVILLVGLVMLVNAQTFQYSRGWTNGKRASTSEAGANPVFMSRVATAGLDTLKPNEKALLRQFLRNPCDLRIANLLAGHPGKELFSGVEFDSAETGGPSFVLPQFLIDPEDGNGGTSVNVASGRPVGGNDLRFKRDVVAPLGDLRQKIA